MSNKVQIHFISNLSGISQKLFPLIPEVLSFANKSLPPVKEGRHDGLTIDKVAQDQGYGIQHKLDAETVRRFQLIKEYLFIITSDLNKIKYL